MKRKKAAPSFTSRMRLPLVLFLLTALLAGCLPLRTDSAIYDRVIRLHVLASSDSEADQALKYQVRDALLEQTAALLSDCASPEEAAARLEGAATALTDCADRVLRGEGSDLRAHVTLCREDYPTREYAGFRLPRGRYTSLKVVLGEGEGQNWWCVLYPSLCLSASLGQTEDAFLAAGFTPDQIRVLTETEDTGYVVRFRILEWLGGLFGGRKNGK